MNKRDAARLATLPVSIRERIERMPDRVRALALRAWTGGRLTIRRKGKR